MIKKKIRKNLVSIMYLSLILVVLISIFLIEGTFTRKSNDKDRLYIYVMKNLLDNEIPVVGRNNTMLRPFTDSNVKIVRNFYSYLDDKQKQENSLIYHDNMYMQNSGIDFGGVPNFDVIAILDGTVINVSEDPLLGKTIEIRHNNEMISVYQSLSEMKVKKRDNVLRGQVIGKSGLSNISKDLKDHLHFELFYKGQVVNPLDYFDKKIE